MAILSGDGKLRKLRLLGVGEGRLFATSKQFRHWPHRNNIINTSKNLITIIIFGTLFLPYP